jgi:hypothetical protein
LRFDSNCKRAKCARAASTARRPRWKTLDYPVAPQIYRIEIENQRVRMFYMDAASGTVGGLAPFSPRPMTLPAVFAASRAKTSAENIGKGQCARW